MRLVDQLRYGPFAAAYYRALVDDEFKSALESYFERELLPQLDAIPTEIEGTIIPKYDKDSFCHPECLVRNIFHLDAVIVDSTGASKLDSDIAYDSEGKSFSAWTDHSRQFYAWTPARKKQREAEVVAINRLIDDLLGGSGAASDDRGDWNKSVAVTKVCPICGGEVECILVPDHLHMRCVSKCFRVRRNWIHGKFLSGSTSIKHPLERVTPRQ